MSNYLINGFTLVEEFGTNATSSASRVMTGLNLNYTQGNALLQLWGAQYSANFHFPTGTAAISNAGFRLNNSTNWLNNQVVRAGFAPMSRRVISRTSNGVFNLQYDSINARARWVDMLAEHDNMESITPDNHGVFACPPCIIMVACGAGGRGAGGHGLFWASRGGGGGAGGVAVAQINLHEIARINGGGSWRNCLRAEVSMTGDTVVYRYTGSSRSVIMRGNRGNNGSNNNGGGGGSASVTQTTGIVRRAGHDSVSGSSSPLSGRTGARGGHGGSGGSFSNLYTSFSTGYMGMINQSAIVSSYGSGGATNGGGGSIYGNGGSGGGGGGFGAGGGGLTGNNDGSHGSAGIVVIYA